MKLKLIALGLILFGSIQMIGDVCHIPLLKGIGQATNASPAPKVFTSQNGYETFSKRFYFEYKDNAGETRMVEITPKNYQFLRGPYNRRNMYGATISYGPVLVSLDKTKPLFDNVSNYAMCQRQSILDEMGIAYDKSKPLKLIIKERLPKNDNKKWTKEFTFQCGVAYAQ